MSSKNDRGLGWLKKLFRIRSIKRVAKVVTFVFSLLLGVLWDTKKAQRKEDATDLRRDMASLRWVSVVLWVGIATLLTTLGPFWRSFVDVVTSPWLGWAFGWMATQPHIIWASGLPIGAFAVVSSVIIWTVVANRITVWRTRKNPAPEGHGWTARYESTRGYWFMVGFAMVPAGVWLALTPGGLDASVTSSLDRDGIALNLTLAAMAVAVVTGVLAGRGIRADNAAAHKRWQRFDTDLEQVLGITPGTLAAERAKPAAERKYATKDLPGDGVQVTLPPGTPWRAVVPEKRKELAALVARHMPKYELSPRDWPQGLIFMAVTDKELTRRQALIDSGFITSAPLGFTDPDDDGTVLRAAVR